MSAHGFHRLRRTIGISLAKVSPPIHITRGINSLTGLSLLFFVLSLLGNSTYGGGVSSIYTTIIRGIVPEET